MIKRSIEKIFLRMKCCNELMNRITGKSPRIFFQDCMKRDLLEARSLEIHRNCTGGNLGYIATMMRI